MKIIFFGTPFYVLPVLKTLQKAFKEHHESPIVAVVTQRPKPSGRKKLLQYSAIDQWAHEREKPIFFEPEDLIVNNIKADIGVLAAYGKIIPKKVIDHFPHGILNIHPSLLPEFRGASPVQATLASGNKKAGVTIMKMDEELDHGPIISQVTEDVLEDDTTESLRNRLFNRSVEVLETLIPAYIGSKITLKKQNHQKATFTKLVKKSDAFIDPEALNTTLQGYSFKEVWEIPFIADYKTEYTPETIHNFIRAMHSWPIAWTNVQLDSKNKNQKPKRLKIIKSHLESKSPESRIKNLVIDTVQLEGKTEVSWKQFTSGYPFYKF